MKNLIVFSAIGFFVFSGCSTLSQETIFESVKETTTKSTHNDLQWIKTAEQAHQVDVRVRHLLSKPLDTDDAVRIALINNRGLQQTYEKLGIAHSELVQAGLMSNPLLGYSLGRGGGVTTSSVSVEFAFLDLLWIPLRKELSGLMLQETQYTVGNEVMNVVRETRKRFIDARTVQQTVELNQELLISYETSLQIAMRQYTAGNLSKRDYLRIQERYNHARLESIRLNKEMADTREALNQMMGVFGKNTYYTFNLKSSKLDKPPSTSEQLEQMAIENRLDIAAAKKAVEYASKEAGYTQNTRLLDEVTLEGQSEKSSGDARFNTFGIKIPLPLFDMGQGRMGLAEAKYNQSVHRLYELAVNVRSQTREAYANLRYAYDIAHEYRENVVPTNQSVLQETQLFYNGMLDGIDELLEDQRHLSESKIDAVIAAGEYWNAQADLAYIIGGPIPLEKEEK